MAAIKNLPYTRQRQILNRIKDSECVRIEDLAEELNVSTMTIYRDIQELVKSGEARRVYGGVKAVDDEDAIPELIRPYTDTTIEERFQHRKSEKDAIAEKAASLVKEGEVIAIDPSTTTLHMCSYLQEKNIMVVTTSISVALQFASSDTVSVYMCGGRIRKSALSVVGSMVQDSLSRLNISKCFLSSRALNYEKGLTDVTMEEADSKRQLIKRSDELFALLDHTKIGKVAPFEVCDLSSINAIITDEAARNNPDMKTILENCGESGTEVIFAE